MEFDFATFGQLGLLVMLLGWMADKSIGWVKTLRDGERRTPTIECPHKLERLQSMIDDYPTHTAETRDLKAATARLTETLAAILDRDERSREALTRILEKLETSNQTLARAAEGIVILVNRNGRQM